MAVKNWKSIPLYSVLFVLYPLLALLGFNISEVPAKIIWRPMGVLLLGMLVVLILLFLIIRNWHRAALSASILTLLFFTYGHVYLYLKSIEIGGVILGRHRQLLPIWAALGMAGCWWAWKKIRKPEALVSTLNLISIFLLIFPSYQIVSSVLHDYSIRRNTVSKLNEKSSELPLGYAPDIYYIILDGYGRADSLQTLFGYDNSEFVNFLQSKGFYVAQCSQSNYSQTILSLSSALNLNYISEITDDVSEDSRDKSPLVFGGQYNRTRKELESLGYNIVSFKTNFPISEWTDADYYLEPQLKGMNDFELVLAQTTAWRIPMDFAVHRMYNLNAYYFPDGPSGLYETITPINSFRLVFNKYFGQNYELLDDVSRYSSYRTPYQYKTISNACNK